MNFQNSQTPEEEELQIKQQILCDLENQIIEKEVEFATIKNKIANFEFRYFMAVGPTMVEWESLRQRILDIISDFSMVNPSSSSTSETSFINNNSEIPLRPNYKSDLPSIDMIGEDIKTIFRKLAKCIHPDLSSNSDERKIREEFMKRANEALSTNNIKNLLAIQLEWDSRPESILGSDPGAMLIQTIRKIAQINNRIKEIKLETDELLKSDIGELYNRVNEYDSVGIDLLSQLRNEIENKIGQTIEQLHLLVK